MLSLSWRLLIFWLASLVASALEINAAGDFALIESGFIGTDDFSDPNLAKWSIDFGTEGESWERAWSAARGYHIVQKHFGNHARYIASPVSPTIVLPTDRMQVSMLCTFAEAQDVHFSSDCAVMNACKAVAEADALNYAVSYNRVWFGTKVAYGHRVNGSLIPQTTGVTNGAGTIPKWLGTLTDPEGDVCGYPGEVCSQFPGTNLHCSQLMSEAWACAEPGAGGWCESDLFGRTGWPAWGSYYMTACDPPDFEDHYGFLYEYWGWKWPWIEVRGVPSGYYVKVVQDAGHPTSHPTYTLPGETKTSSTAPGSGWAADECGYTHDRICVYGAGATPPFQTVEVRKQSDDSLLTAISPTAFLPGALGGDIYTLCVEALTVPCPPLSETTHFFFGGRISPTSMLTRSVGLDAVIQEPPPPSVFVLLDEVLSWGVDPQVVSTSEDFSNSATQVVLTKPVSPPLIDGDVVYVFVKNGGGGTWSESTATFAKVREDTWIGIHTIALFRKVITSAAGEPASWQFDTSVSATQVAGLLLVVRNADNTTPEDVTPTYVLDQNDAQPESPAITPTTDGCLILAYCFQSNSTVTFVAPSGFALEETTGSTPNTFTAAASKLLPTAAPDGPYPWLTTGGAGGDDSLLYSVAVRPGP